MSAEEQLSRSGRLRRADLRTSDQRLRRYQEAAALDAAAEEAFRRHRTITLSEERMRAFVEDLLNPGEPGELTPSPIVPVARTTAWPRVLDLASP